MKESMKKRFTVLLSLLFLFVGIAMAQTQVKGTVVSADDGEPLPGVAVKVEGTTIGTTTNMDGQFVISIPEANSRLRISHIGMVPRVMRARNGMRVELESDNKVLDEVMVVAYGTAKKSAFTGSAKMIDAGEIAKVQVANPVDALKGKVAGVQLNNNSGAPGSSPSIHIRGFNSIAAGTQPLYVVDGVVFEGDLNNISPQDIESMSVLKDAAAGALYGARGANGVILITTKKGRTGKSDITVDVKLGSNSKATPDHEYIKDPALYYQMWYNSLYNYGIEHNGLSPIAANAWANQNLTADNNYGLGYQVYNVPAGELFFGLDGTMNPHATLGNPHSYDGQDYLLYPDDWSREVFRNSLRQEYNVTANGSNDLSSYFLSAGYLKNEGITRGSSMERFTARLKADYQMRPWLRLATNVSYAHYDFEDSNSDEGDDTSSGNLFSFISAAPIYPLYIRDGQGNIMYDPRTGQALYDYGANLASDDNTIWNLNRPFMAKSNALSATLLDKANSEGNSLNASGTAEIRFLKDFKFTSANTVYVDEYRGTSTTNPYFGQYASSEGTVSKSHGRQFSTNFLQQLDWRHEFGDHHVEAMVAHEFYRRKTYSLSGSKTHQVDPTNDELASAVVDGTPSSSRSDYQTEGWLGRVQYDFAQKYFGSASFRRDATTRFDKGHWWGNFWSLGGGWLLNKEKFLAPYKWIDELKLKASFGQNGNDAIDGYLYTNTYSVVNSDDHAALSAGQKGNRELSWETTSAFNTGVDFSLFRGRLRGTLEYYYKKTSDMLYFFSYPASFGWSGIYDNIGDMRNQGVEVELAGDVIRTRDFTWSLYLNMATNDNKVTYMPEENKTTLCDGVNGYYSGSYFVGEGQSLYTFRLRKYAGVDPTTGEALYWKDVTDADGNVTGQTTVTNPSEATYHLCGKALPDVYGGFGTSFEFKGFDLSVDFTYQLGGQVYDSDYQSSMSGYKDNRGYAWHSDLLNAWTPTNTSSNIPRFQYDAEYQNASSDRWLTSANYLSLNNITIGYTLPKKWIKPLHLTKVRFYAVGDNLYLWSKRKGLDPRRSITGGGTNASYRSVRTISGGVTVTF